MKSAVVLLPGLNRDRDMIAALTKISGKPPLTVWQTDTEIPDVDLIAIPGGFSYGDYLRCGAIAARMPVLRAVAEKAAQGVLVMGVCNGFQILLEAGLLPGALMRNASLRFVCREVRLSVANANTPFSRGYAPGQVIRCPVAHHDGNYFADDATLERTGEEVRRVLETVRGAADLQVEVLSGAAQVEIDLDRARMARYGLNVSDVRDVVETAVGGKTAT